MENVYALIWRSHQPDDSFSEKEFSDRVPRLMVWLRDLHAKGKLLGCGGGGFEDRSGGLTIVRADSPEEAKAISEGTPMNEIGATEIMYWGVYYADLVDKERLDKLVATA